MIQRIYRRVWENAFFPIYLCLKPTDPRSSQDSIHLWISRHHFHDSYPIVGWTLWFIMVLLWPVRLMQLTLKATRRMGSTVVKETGIPVRRQFCEQLRFGILYGLPPIEYYRYGFFRHEKQGELLYTMLQHQVTPLSRSLNPDRHLVKKQETIIADKEHFAAYCAKYNLPTPQIVAIFDGQRVTTHPEAFSTNGPNCSIFVKPLRGTQGQDTMAWQYIGKGCYVREQEAPMTWDKVEYFLQMRSSQHPIMVQPLLANHPDLVDLAPGALATIRILSGRRPDGRIDPIAATFKMALRDDQIINTHGLNSPIDLQSGTLGRAYTYRPLCPGYEFHPATNATIAGRRLPHWSQALALAQAAHKHLPHYVFLGWDIALTPTGPLLLEGNAGWDVLTVQKPQQKPLGKTCFADICLLWMKHQG